MHVEHVTADDAEVTVEATRLARASDVAGVLTRVLARHVESRHDVEREQAVASAFLALTSSADVEGD